MKKGASKNPTIRGLYGLGKILSVLVLIPFLNLGSLLADEDKKPDREEQQPAKPGEAQPASTSATSNDDSHTNSVVAVTGTVMDTLDDQKTLGVGDTVIFRVLEDQEEPKPLTVTDTGDLDVPELGLVKAAGKTSKELAFEIKSKLEQTTYYRATVQLGIQLLNKTISGRRIYIAGQVRTTGPQEIPAGETWTVSRAIMGAGGFTDYADKKKVRVIRAGSKGNHGKTYVVNVAEVLEKGQTQSDLDVEPEDLIFVPGRAINF